MAELPPHSEATDDLDEDKGTPGWVKVFGLIALILIVLFVGLHLAGGGLRVH